MEKKNSIHKSAGNSSKKREAANNMAPCDGIWCTKYTNRWGQEMVASRYGYKAWHFWLKK